MDNNDLVNQAYIDYEFDYCKKKIEVCGNLLHIYNNEDMAPKHRRWILDAINFIIEGKI